MKMVLAWVKSNLLIVIALAVTLIASPVMLFFGAQWNSAVRAGVEQEVSKNVKELDALEVSVQVDPISPADQPISTRTLPNDATIEAVSIIFEARRRDSEAVVSRANEFNERGRRLLISGSSPADTLFPEPKNDSTRLTLLTRLMELWPRAHAQLLERSKAGGPPAAESVAADLEEGRARAGKQRLAGREEQKLTPEEEAQVTKILSDRRLELYRQRARQVSFYADPEVFKSVGPWAEPAVPAAQIADETMKQAWEWQWLYWIHEDVIAAVVLANTDPVKGWLPVYEAPVKRIESITVARLERSPSGSEPGEPAAAAAGGDPSARIMPDYTRGVSGRAAWPSAPNPVYDIRAVDLIVLVAADRLPVLLDAISKTNFMTVVDMKTAAAPSRPELLAGFDFGGDYLLRAELRVETVWLRSWMSPLMPKPVRAMLGIADPPAPEAGAEAAPSPPPA